MIEQAIHRPNIQQVVSYLLEQQVRFEVWQYTPDGAFVNLRLLSVVGMEVLSRIYELNPYPRQ